MLVAVAEPTPSPTLPEPQERRIRRSWGLFVGSFVGIGAIIALDAITSGLRLLDLVLLALLAAAGVGAFLYRTAVDRAEAGRRTEVETFARILQGLSRSVSPDAIVNAIVEELGSAVDADHIVVVRRRPDSRVLEATLVSTHPGVPSSTTVLPISDLEIPVLTARRDRRDETDPYRMAVPIPIEPELAEESADAGEVPGEIARGDDVGADLVAASAATRSRQERVPAATGSATMRASGETGSATTRASDEAGHASARPSGVARDASVRASANAWPASPRTPTGVEAGGSGPGTGSASAVGGAGTVSRAAGPAPGQAAWPVVGPDTVRSSWRAVVGALGPRAGNGRTTPKVGSAIPERRFGRGPTDDIVVATSPEPGTAEQVAERIALRVRDVYGLRHVLAAPIKVRDEPIGAVIISRRTDAAWSEASRRVLRGAAVEASAALSRAYSHRRAETEASTDALTGLPNRRYFDEYCALLARRRRRSDAVGVLMIDIDRFKRLNDRHGHAVGDHVLQAVGGAIGSAIRDDDVPARYGGEEFAVVLRNPSRAVAIEVGERIRSAVGRIDLRRLGVPSVTVSVGVAVAQDPDEQIGEIIERADRALYRAKHAGRDRVVAA